MTKRCGWVKMNNPLYVAYHDEEWGRPLHDDWKLFELLCMETYQAGLSWEAILNKRQAFREAFHFYDAQKIAQMTDADLDGLLDNPDIIRNKMKLYATRANAQAFWLFKNNTVVLIIISGLLLDLHRLTILSRITDLLRLKLPCPKK